MGLYAFEVIKLIDLVKQLPKPFTVLSFGHPDILASPSNLEAALGFRPTADGDGVMKSRKGKIEKNIIGNAHLLFEEMGGELTVADINEDYYGVDIKVDLNQLVVRVLDTGRYDLVIDPGTAEHCFDVGAALINMASAVKVGGYIYHRNPMCHWNHGFWNFSPAVFAHLYSKRNGFELEFLSGERRGNWLPVSLADKFEIPHNGRKLQIVCIAKRISDVPILTPIQGKYASSSDR